MSKTRNNRDEALGIPGNPDYVVHDDDVEIGVDDMFNELIIPASGSKTVKLPSVQAAKNRWFHFISITDLGGTGFAVEDRDDAAVPSKNYATAGNGLAKAGATLSLFCNGRWYQQMHADLS